MSVDPFTYASPTYQNAMRHPHRSGQGYEGFEPRSSVLGRVLHLLLSLLAVAAFVGFVVMLVS